MKKHASWWRASVAATLALSMAASGAPVALAQANVPDWAVDDQAPEATPLTTQAALPRKYDLRSEGIVTPVKLQNPWGSCWAFGGIATAESSILAAYGATYKEAKLDLSERHLAMFAFRPVTKEVNESQVGEGMVLFSSDPNAALDAGGQGMYVTTLFSQGVGPLPEALFPYHGKEGLTAMQYLERDPDKAAKEQITKEVAMMGMTYEQYIEAMAANGETEEQVLQRVADTMRKLYSNGTTYAAQDDWYIPDANEKGESNRLLSAGFVLKNGNVLPHYWNADYSDNSEATRAMKQELVNGRAVSLMYGADQSGKYTASSEEKGSMYAQYAFDPLATNHSVCIVGYDDDYDASNFTHTTDGKGSPLTDAEGNPLSEEQAAEITTPPGNGAWLVKNSWGSETDPQVDDLGNLTGMGTKGIKNAEGKATGYFYLSYYDQSISQVETMEFSTDLASDDGFATVGYDYMPAVVGFFNTDKTTDVQSAANVFPFDGDMKVTSVSTRTSEENMRVTISIYKLAKGTTDPTDGELLEKTSRNYEYSGFHRVDLERPLEIKDGDTISVVTTASVVNEEGEREYCVSANMGPNEAEAKRQNLKFYTVAVVNEGESLVYYNGEWKDWKEFIESQSQVIDGKEIKLSDSLEVDNFSIKLYGTVEAKADGWECVGNDWYYYKGGELQTGWIWDAGQWYFAGSDGKMVVGWHWDSQYKGWYYFSEKHDGSYGHMLRSTTTPDGSKVDASGRWVA